MKLKTKYGTQADLDAALDAIREAFAAEDGEFVLSDEEFTQQLGEGDGAKSAMRELRSDLKKADKRANAAEALVDELTGEDGDADDLRDRLDDYERLKGLEEAGDLGDPDKFRAAVDDAADKRVSLVEKKKDREIARLQTDLQTANAERDAARDEVQNLGVTNAAKGKASQLKIRDGFQKDFEAAAAREFKFENGELVNEDGVSFDDWSAQYVADRPGIDVEWSANASGDRGGSPSGNEGPNPFAPGPGFNVTEQMRLTQTDPAKAARLKKAAGK